MPSYTRQGSTPTLCSDTSEASANFYSIYISREEGMHIVGMASFLLAVKGSFSNFVLGKRSFETWYQ